MANIFNRFTKAKNLVTKDEKKNDIKRSTIYQTTRATQDLKGWRDAILEAENNNIKYRVKMNTIYKDCVLDGQVKSCMNKRKNLTLLQDFALFDSDNNIDLESTKLIKKKFFSEICNYILDSKFYGFNLINWTDVINNELKNIQIVNREFVNVDGKFFSDYPYSTSGRDIFEKDLDNWTLYCTTTSDNGISNCGYGLLYEVALYQILLRNNLSYNTDFAERFGMPITVLTTDRQEDEDLNTIERNLQNLGSNGYFVKDSTDTIDYLEFTNSDNGYQVYDNLEKRLNAMVSKLLLGHADAIDSTTGTLGAGQGEDSPVATALREIKSVDSVYLSSYVNDMLIPKLRNLGLKIKEGLVFNFINSEEKEQAETKLNKTRSDVTTYVKTLAEAGYKVDEKWLSEELGIPVTQALQPTQNVDLKKKVTNESNAFDSLVKRIFDKEKVTYDYDLFKQIKKDLDVFSNDKTKNSALSDRKDLVNNLMQNDQVRFSFAKSQAEIDRLNSIYKKDISFSEFKKQANTIDNQYNKNYLKTEYDTAYNRMLNTDEYLDKSTRYKYATWKQIQRTTKRDAHKYLNGITFNVLEIPTLPPTDYNCGCELVYSNDKGNLQTPEFFKSDSEAYQSMLDNGFFNNPAKTGEIFGNAYDEYKKSISLKDQGFKMDLFAITLIGLKEDIQWNCVKKGSEWIITKLDMNGNEIEVINMTETVLSNVKNMIIL